MGNESMNATAAKVAREHLAAAGSHPPGERAETFGVFAEVRNAYSEDGYPSITVYTARGDSQFGHSQSAYWSLTLEEAERLGVDLLEHVGRAQERSRG